MRKMFFCYERNMFDNWNPVIYYDELSELKIEARHDRRQVIEIDMETLSSKIPHIRKDDLLYYLESVYPLKAETNDENRSPDAVPDN